MQTPLKMYGIHNCDTIKKAQKFLRHHHIAFEFIDFRVSPIDAKTLQSFADKVGWEKLINKRSTTYRQLSAFDKQNISPSLMLKNPTLIKRPVLVGQNIKIGFSEKSYSQLI